MEARPLARRIRTALLEHHVLEYPRPGRPALLMLHGIRDSAWGLDALAREVAREHHVYSADLRGHGDSDKPGSYSMAEFTADVLALLDALALSRARIVAHSLGARAASFLAAAYPERVERLAMLEGLGPPPRPAREPHRRARWEIEHLLGLRTAQRPLADRDDAAARLRRNHPRLDPERAGALAGLMTEPHPEGGLRWKWDPRVESVWATTDEAGDAAYWAKIEAPTLIVEGALAGEYWGAPVEPPVSAARVAAFPDARHVYLEHCGHMVHYDDPAGVGAIVREFLRSAPG